MTTANVYYVHAVKLLSGTITQLTEATPSYGFTDLVEFASGQTGPQFTGTSQSNPDLNFTSVQLNTVLAEIDTEGICVDLSGGNVDIEYKKGNPHGTRVADGTAGHLRGRLESNALLYWESIRASQGQNAEIRARLLPVWDTVNDPIVFTNNVALTATSAANPVYTLGRIDLNGTNIAAVTDLDWNNNIQAEEVADSGEPFISYGAIRTFSPQFTFRSRDTTLLQSYGSRGTTLTSFEVYFRKRSTNLISVADGTAEHIKLSNASASGLIKARQATGNDGIVEVFVQLLKPAAGTDPFAINTASTIT